MGFKQSGVQLAYLLGGFLLPIGAITVGWRPTVLLLAGIGLTATVGVRFIKITPTRSNWSDAPSTRQRSRPRSIAVGWITVYAFFMGAGGAVLVGFLPLFAEDALGFDLRLAGLVAVLIGIVGMAARVWWSVKGERMDRFAFLLGTMAAISVVSGVSIMSSESMGPWLLWVGAGMAGVAVVAWNGLANLAVVAASDDAKVGRSSGVLTVGFLGGYATAPPVFGWITDQTGEYRTGWIMVTVLFVCAWLATWGWSRHEIRALEVRSEQS